MAENEQQVVSRSRVREHGEVYTSSREVNAMLDLVEQETLRIESRFLEPACGNGNFIAEVLTRKLGVVGARYSMNQVEYERYAILALSSIYGIDILEDNVLACRDRLLRILLADYRQHFEASQRPELGAAAAFILGRNIIWGDALTLRTADGHDRPIVFSEWSPVNGSLLKRRDFSFGGLMEHEAVKETPLFSDLGEDAFIPTPLREYPLTHFLRIADADSQL